MSDAPLRSEIERLSQVKNGLRVIRMETVHTLSRSHQRTIREIELAALEADIVPWHYQRSLGTIGIEGQITLLRSTVAVVGLGGLGGYVTEALARMGVGRLVLIDGDVFEEHNMNRQLLSTEARVGTLKTDAARQHVSEINSAVEPLTYAEMLTSENLPQLLAGVEVVIDALDRLPTRLALQHGAQALGIPMVHGSIAGFLGQAMTIFPDDLGLHSLYGPGQDLPEHGMEAELGTPAATPMAVAAWEAQEVIKILLHRGQLLRHRLLVIDMEAGTCESLELQTGKRA